MELWITLASMGSSMDMERVEMDKVFFSNINTEAEFVMRQN